MSHTARQAVPDKPDEQESAPPRAPLELWLALSKLPWRSLMMVPASPGDSTAALAKALAEIGQRLSYAPVTAITINTLEYGTALALVDLQQHIDRSLVPAPEPQPDPAPSDGTPEGEARARAEAPTTQALTVIPPARVIISIPSIVSEPLGLSAAQEADMLVVMVRLGRSRMADVRRTIQLVGRERLAGCFLER